MLVLDWNYDQTSIFSRVIKKIIFIQSIELKDVKCPKYLKESQNH